METGLAIARGTSDQLLLPGMTNRHGLIAGATGTGKTITLRVMAEQLSSIGVPVFMADVKGIGAMRLRTYEGQHDSRRRSKDC